MYHVLDQEPLLPKAAAIPRAVACLNALTHGGTAQKLLLPDEDPTLLDILFSEAFELHQPANTNDAALVTDAVEARWLLWRRQRAHLNIEYSLYTGRPESTLWSKEDFHALELADRYKTQAERALRRALVNVNAVRKDALQSERWRDLLAIKREQVRIAGEKLELSKAKDARLAPKQAAEALVDAMLAQQILDHKRGQDELLAKAAAQQKVKDDHIQFSESLNCHVVKQTIKLLCHDNGAAWIDSIKPSHDILRSVIQHSDQYEQAPELILRKFEFETYVPNEYRFLLDLGYKRPLKGKFSCEHAFDLDAFLKLAETERKILARQPNDDDES